jgi:hypothetical protein
VNEADNGNRHTDEGQDYKEGNLKPPPFALHPQLEQSTLVLDLFFEVPSILFQSGHPLLRRMFRGAKPFSIGVEPGTISTLLDDRQQAFLDGLVLAAVNEFLRKMSATGEAPDCAESDAQGGAECPASAVIHYDLAAEQVVRS